MPDAHLELDSGTLDARILVDASPIDAAPEDTSNPTEDVADAGFSEDTGLLRDAEADPRECYEEPYFPYIPIDDVRTDFRTRRRSGFNSLKEVLRRRYPAGYDLLVEEQNDPYTGSFVDSSSFSTVMESAMTEVHEATHGWDYGHSLFPVQFSYWLRTDLQHRLTFDVNGFARSEIYQMLEDNSTDLYARTYLRGEQGTREFLELLDELNCYVNGLGAITVTGEELTFGLSGRDGAVAFLYYVQLYLRKVRVEQPSLYQVMQNDSALVEHLKLQWLRTHFYLEYADQIPRIGIRDADIRALLYAPHNMFEISNLIGRCIDPSPCLCD